MVDKAEQGLQQVVAVVTPPDDMQKQIQLGWRRKTLSHVQ